MLHFPAGSRHQRCVYYSARLLRLDNVLYFLNTNQSRQHFSNQQLSHFDKVFWIVASVSCSVLTGVDWSPFVSRVNIYFMFRVCSFHNKWLFELLSQSSQNRLFILWFLIFIYTLCVQRLSKVNSFSLSIDNFLGSPSNRAVYFFQPTPSSPSHIFCFHPGTQSCHFLNWLLNSTDSVITKASSFCDITTILQWLHWRLVMYKMQFKILPIPSKPSITIPLPISPISCTSPLSRILSGLPLLSIALFALSTSTT